MVDDAVLAERVGHVVHVVRAQVAVSVHTVALVAGAGADNASAGHLDQLLGHVLRLVAQVVLANEFDRGRRQTRQPPQGSNVITNQRTRFVSV